ncbi:MAG: class 3 adenylate cyclase [Rhodothermales bacterium]|jgi:class 3 adenylate cyclase
MSWDGKQRQIDELTVLRDLAIEIGKARDLDGLMRTLVRRSITAVGGREGTVTLLNPGDLVESGGKTLFRTSVDTASNASYRPTIGLIAWIAESGKASRFVSESDAFTSVLAVPMISEGQTIGVLSVFDSLEGAFSERDQHLLTIIGAQSAKVLEAARLAEDRDRIVAMFGRYAAQSVVEHLIRDDQPLKAKRLSATILFVDVRGFSSLAESISPEETVDYLNGLFEQIIPPVIEHGGIVHQLLGDGLMAIFGAPIELPNDAQAAFDAARAMRDAVRMATGSGLLRPTRLGVGINRGDVVAGLVGTANRYEYKVTGDSVNIAARLEQLNKELGTDILLSASVMDRLEQGTANCTSVGPQALRGRGKEIVCYKVE